MLGWIRALADGERIDGCTSLRGRAAAARCAAALLVVLAASALAGCANFKAVSKFAGDTTQLTGTIRNEFLQLENLCFDQAELSIVVENLKTDKALKDCADFRASQGKLAALTIDVLDAYAGALAALADNRSFDLSPAIQNVGGKVQALIGPDGQPLIAANHVGALTKIVDLLADVVTSTQREIAVRRMVAEAPNLKITGDLIRSFFVPPPGAPANARSAYENLVRIISNSFSSTEATLNSPFMRDAEPIRTGELLRQVRARQAAIEPRTGRSADRVPMKMVAAIDAWQQSVDVFATDALKPDPEALYARLKVLREKTFAAKEAVEDLRQQ